MKYLPLMAALIFTGGFASRGQDPPADKESEARHALLKLEREWADALVKRDTTRLDRILNEDYVLTTPLGQLVTKAQEFEQFKAPRNDSFEIRKIDLIDMAVRIYGDSAVVTYRFMFTVREEGRDIETPFRHTDVFVRRDGRWRCVSRQATRIAAVPAAAPNTRHLGVRFAWNDRIRLPMVLTMSGDPRPW